MAGFSAIIGTANAHILEHLGDVLQVGVHQVQGMYDMQEVETAAGFIMAPVLVVSPVDAAKINKGDPFSHNGNNFLIDLRHPDNEGMIVLELKCA